MAGLILQGGGGGLVPAGPMGWRGPRGYVPRGRRGQVRYSRWALAGVALAFLLAFGGFAATEVAKPSPAPSLSCAPAGAAGGLTADQRDNATRIVAVGRAMGVPERGQVVALATAMQESQLRNLDYGDRDSLGLFQQRPSQGWGTPAQVQNPEYAARKFYDGLNGVKGWERMPVTVAAQAVQRSGFPDAYAKWQPQATALVTGTTCSRKA